MTAHEDLSVKTLYVIHHTHTDIGYTELQGRVARWQSDFIRQALDIIERTGERVGPNFDGFRWTCETFWGVERFLERATDEEAEAFAAAVRSGAIGLSGNYLNSNELLGYETLARTLARAAEYGGSIGAPADSAMTADINGYSWGDELGHPLPQAEARGRQLLTWRRLATGETLGEMVYTPHNMRAAPNTPAAAPP